MEQVMEQVVMEAMEADTALDMEAMADMGLIIVWVTVVMAHLMDHMVWVVITDLGWEVLEVVCTDQRDQNH